MICDKDCLNCKYDDCINDRLSLEELQEKTDDLINPPTKKQLKERERLREYYRENPEINRANYQRYLENNREKEEERLERYKKNNRLQARLRFKQWYYNLTPEQKREYNRKKGEKKKKGGVQKMNCPKCDCDTNIVDSRRVEGTIRRRRECQCCGYRFSTKEVIEKESRSKSMKS